MRLRRRWFRSVGKRGSRELPGRLHVGGELMRRGSQRQRAAQASELIPDPPLPVQFHSCVTIKVTED